MNHCVLLAEVLSDPELRYTPDNQTPIATFSVEFAGLRPDDPVSRVRVVGWGNLAQEVVEKYHKGDRLLIEGRLGMNTVEREGFKEKRAELTAQRIFALGGQGEVLNSSASTPTPSTRTETNRAPASRSTPGYTPAPELETPAPKAQPAAVRRTKVAPPPPIEPDLDDIPF
ncbi:single-stranded DNA-binding protein [Leptolyngbya sp. FACHB-261]|uniref:single-stranded DNA-binding protein n=1 Tax=Leptolyngbya sp. FACHB-261 TaxID=2692806 RepID=UPI0016878E01|nr:single-stranded DNA-binding protein [Leptolyngbya sp. FACHB-261]MBD2100710.1 single-stranded DNA-binding protein [Leptolyngbya sp. FACHB-261]